MPVYTNTVQVEITMDAECASTAHSIASRLGGEAAEQIKRAIDDANPGLPPVTVVMMCDYQGEPY